MSARRRTTWREKLADDKDLPKVIAITGKLRRRWGTGACAIPAPREVDALIRPKFPGGIAEQARRLRAEGHELLPGKGKRPPGVVDWEERSSPLQVMETSLFRSDLPGGHEPPGQGTRPTRCRPGALTGRFVTSGDKPAANRAISAP